MTVGDMVGNDASYNLEVQEDFTKEAWFVFLKYWGAFKVEEMLTSVRLYVKNFHPFRRTEKVRIRKYYQPGGPRREYRSVEVVLTEGVFKR